MLDTADALDLLRRGDLEIEGRLVDASNTTVRAIITVEAVTARCVYKPVRGERPLWDFPDGTLAGRERSAFLIAEATGWDLVPPTILRDGPLGVGAVQLWLDEQDQEEPPLGFIPARQVPKDWHVIASARDEQGKAYRLAHADDPRLARLAVFDAVINNADRKGGHILATVDGRLRGVDHGVSFHAEPKLRTILWGWTGRPLPEEAGEVLAKLAADLSGELGEELAEHLTRAELTALATRIEVLRTTNLYPAPPEDWPAIPWPPV